MQQYHADASGYFKSLDKVYFLQGHEHKQVALESHTPLTNEEMELAIGDQISITGNQWNGFSNGTNKRSSRSGLYPTHKVGEEVRIVKMPTYPEADWNNHKRD